MYKWTPPIHHQTTKTSDSGQQLLKETSCLVQFLHPRLHLFSLFSRRGLSNEESVHRRKGWAKRDKGTQKNPRKKKKDGKAFIFPQAFCIFCVEFWKSNVDEILSEFRQQIPSSDRFQKNMTMTFIDIAITFRDKIRKITESQDVDMDVGTAPDGLSLSTTAVHYQMFSPSHDELEVSICTS